MELEVLGSLGVTRSMCKHIEFGEIGELGACSRFGFICESSPQQTQSPCHRGFGDRAEPDQSRWLGDISSGLECEEL